MNIFRSVLPLLFLLASSAVAPAQGASGDLKVDIEVFQALREGVKGIGFDRDHARIGLPFPAGAVRAVNGRPGIEIRDREFQARILKSWPDGSVKWGVVELLTSVGKDSADRVQLVAGKGVSDGAPLARDLGKTVLVDTGPLQVEVKKEGFNLFDKVTLGGRPMVAPGASRGIVLTDREGNEYLASQDANTRVRIEENGPVKAVVRVDGSHVKGRARLLDYTVRLFFYKGKGSVTAQYTLRNASKRSVSHAFIKSLKLDTALSLQGEAKAGLSLAKGIERYDLKAGALTFYQAVSDFPWMSDGDSFYYHGPILPDYKRESRHGYRQEGSWLWQDGKLLREAKRSEYPDLGFLDLADAGGAGVTAGIRYLAGNWPKSLQANPDGHLGVGLWPQENQTGYWIRFGSHTTFEVMYNFHADSAADPSDEMRRFQYPLVARAPIEWYNGNAEGIYPLYRTVHFNDEKKLAAQLGTNDSLSWRKPQFSVWRYHYWGHGGYTNQHDFARISLMNFLREDRSRARAGEWYLQAGAMIDYYTDWAVFHTDDFSYEKELLPKEHNLDADLSKVVFEWEHQHWYGMPLYYYLTGDERVKDAVLDWGEYVKSLAKPLSLTYMRVLATGMFSLAAMYEFTGDREYLKLADRNFSNLLNARLNTVNPYENIFINWERGYVAGGSGSGWPRVKADLMLGSLLYDGILNYYFFSADDNPLRKKAYQLLMKISDFMYREPYVDGVKFGKPAYWIPYEYNLQNPEKSDQGYKLIGQATFWTIFPYWTGGEDKWLERMTKMMKAALSDGSGAWGSFSYLDHPGYQSMAYILKKKLEEKGAGHN